MIGAVYIERGLDEASALVHRLFDPVIARSARLGAGLDWKTSLQELTAAGVLGVPEYHVEESGPDHQKSFRAVVRVGGRGVRVGRGPVQEGSRAAGGRSAPGTPSAAVSRRGRQPPRRRGRGGHRPGTGAVSRPATGGGPPAAGCAEAGRAVAPGPCGTGGVTRAGTA